MADGRHFENSIISIFQPEIIRFQSNLVRGCLFPFGEWIFEKEIEIVQIQMADRGHIESRFFAYISAPYWSIYANFGMEMNNHMQVSIT